MKIATWNVERLRHYSHLEDLRRACNESEADILVLTETDKRLRLDYRFLHESLPLTGETGIKYAPTENRVTIYTDYPCVRKHRTYDERNAVCVELETERGNILVYGTVIGIYGNRHPSFMADLRKQAEDIERLSCLGDGLCVCGDYNCSFSDNYYFTQAGRTLLLDTFKRSGLSVLTARMPECIDHIAISERIADVAMANIHEWNIDKTLSDHKGISVAF